MFDIEAITLNDSYFKGARILFSHLDKGVDYIIRNKIKDVCIWQGLDKTRHSVSFGFLKNLNHIETFHFMVRLSKKSDLNGLYNLSNLRDFRWVVNNQITIDFSKLTTIETVNIPYYDGMALDKLVNLKNLYIDSVKTENLKFLPKLDSLKLLRIISGKFTSLEGLENCKNLKKLDLRRCFSLVEAHSTLKKLCNLESVTLEACKNHDIDVLELKKRVPHVGIVL